MTLRKFAGLGALLPRKSLGSASGAPKATCLPTTVDAVPRGVSHDGKRAAPKQPERQRSVQLPSPGGGMHLRLGFAR